MFIDSEGGVEKEYTLTRPARQIPVGGYRRSRVGIHLFENIYQRGRHLYAGIDRETQPVGLSGTVVWILPEYHNLHIVERACVECREYAASRRIYPPAPVALAYE